MISTSKIWLTYNDATLSIRVSIKIKQLVNTAKGPHSARPNVGPLLL